MDKKIKFAVVGAGHIGKRHAEMVTRNKDAEMVAFCDIKERQELNLSDDTTPLYATIEEMLEKHPEIDVVNVCTPNGLHAEHCLKALDGKKNVVCEKPMALSKNDAEKVIFRSLEVNRKLFLVMQNRYSPPSVWIKDVMNQKLLGEIYMVQLNCYWNRDDRYYSTSPWKGTADLDGGTLYTQFSHFIDIMYWLFGDIKNIQAKFNDFCHQKSTAFEDSGFVNFDFVNEGMGSINYSTAIWDTNLESSMIIIGEKGSVKIGGQYMNEVDYCNIEGYEMPTLPEASAANDYGFYKGSAANHHFMIANVVDTLKGSSTISTNALEGLKIVDIIERIYELK